VPTPDDPFERLHRRRSRRQRNRRVGTATLALAIALGGTLGAFAAFDHHRTPKPPATHIGGNPPAYIDALWPDRTADELAHTEARIAAGEAEWRLDPIATARRFANDVLAWQNVFVAGRTKLHEPQGLVEVTLTTCDPTGAGSCSFDHTELLELDRFGRPHGPYIVTAVTSPHLKVAVSAGQEVGPRFVRDVVSDLSPLELREVLAESYVYTDGFPKGIGFANGALTEGRPLRLCGQGDLVEGRCVPHQPRLKRPGAGYVVVFRVAGEQTTIGMRSLQMFSGDHVSFPGSSPAPLLDLTARPVRFVLEAAPAAARYPRGVFDSCPDLDGTRPFGVHAANWATGVAVKFSRLWQEGHHKQAARYLDASAGSPEQWGITGRPHWMAGLWSSPARRDGLVRFGCGPRVAAHSWRVLVDDGTKSSSLDFTVYLVKRSYGWRIWGAY
jgi:hypothetical protein